MRLMQTNSIGCTPGTNICFSNCDFLTFLKNFCWSKCNYGGGHWLPPCFGLHVTLTMGFKTRVILLPAHLFPCVWWTQGSHLVPTTCLFHPNRGIYCISISRYSSCKQQMAAMVDANFWQQSHLISCCWIDKWTCYPLGHAWMALFLTFCFAQVRQLLQWAKMCFPDSLPIANMLVCSICSLVTIPTRLIMSNVQDCIGQILRNPLLHQNLWPLSITDL